MSVPSCYKSRVSSGAYDRLSTKLNAMKKLALVGVEYNVNFHRDPSGNYCLSDGNPDNNAPFSTWIFGEIAPRVVGTLHQASGNHNIGHSAPYILIDDATRVKDAFMLRSPSEAPKELAYQFDYQLTVLNSIRLQDEEMESESNQACPFPFFASLVSHPCQTNVKALEWVHPSIPDGVGDLICVFLGPKYQTLFKTSTTTSRKRARTGLQSQRVMVSSPASVGDTSSDSVPVPPPSDVKIGALYDPRLLYDYGGSVFVHSPKIKLMQRNIVDVNKALVPPWTEYEKLRTGTVVLMRVTLKTYQFEDKGVIKKLYQLYADHVRILMESDEPVETRFKRIVPSDGGGSHAPLDATEEECLKLFDDDLPPVAASSSHPTVIGSKASEASASSSDDHDTSASSSTAPSDAPPKAAKTASRKSRAPKANPKLDEMDMD